MHLLKKELTPKFSDLTHSALVVKLTCLFDIDLMQWNRFYSQLELEAFFTAASGGPVAITACLLLFSQNCSHSQSLPLHMWKKYLSRLVVRQKRPWRLDVGTVAVGGIVASNSFPRELPVETRTSNWQHTTGKLQGWQKSDSFPKGRQMQMKY